MIIDPSFWAVFSIGWSAVIVAVAGGIAIWALSQSDSQSELVRILTMAPSSRVGDSHAVDSIEARLTVEFDAPAAVMPRRPAGDGIRGASS